MHSSLFFSTEGIVLQNIPYGNHDQILTLFTKEKGLVKLFCNKTKSKGIHFSPMMNVEIVYREKKSEICACEEISLLQSYLKLRSQLSYLQAACDMILAIQKSQWMGRSVPDLYQLFVYYLNRLPELFDPWILPASLKLKILKYEGLLTPETFVQKNFETDEVESLIVLAFTQDFQKLKSIILTSVLKGKIDRFFLDTLD